MSTIFVERTDADDAESKEMIERRTPMSTDNAESKEMLTTRKFWRVLIMAELSYALFILCK